MPLTITKRPVSLIRFESAPVNPEDVLCSRSNDEEEVSIQDQRKREKRIEELARGYLGGNGLFIQTAPLRRPFDRGNGPSRSMNHP